MCRVLPLVLILKGATSLKKTSAFREGQCLNAPEFVTVGKSDQLELIAVSERTRADRIELRANGQIDQSEIRAIFEGTFSNALELLAPGGMRPLARIQRHARLQSSCE